MQDKKQKERRKYPTLPVLAAGAIIFHEESVLLIRRGHEPAKGLWSIPGGVIRVGEKITGGLEREISEETGVRVSLKGLVEVVERIFIDDKGEILFHYVILDYLAEYLGGDVKSDSDADEAKFISLDHLSDFPLTEGLEEVIQKAMKMREPNRQ